MSRGALWDLVRLVLLALYSLGGIVGVVYLFTVAIGAVKIGGQAAAVVALLTMIALAFASAGCFVILTTVKRIEREVNESL